MRWNCDLCTKPAVSLDMENTFTKSYCDDHAPADLTAQKHTSTEKDRQNKVASVMDYRMRHSLCFICGSVGKTEVLTVFFPPTWWCENHQEKAQEFLLEYS